jgi:acyl dehydratase
MSVYVEFPVTITQDEIDSFCVMTRDKNPQHKRDADRVVAPGMLLSAKALGETDNKFYIVWLIEQQIRFSKSVYIDEPTIVRHTLLRQKQTRAGLLQEIQVDVKVYDDVRYSGKMKILKTLK